MVNGMGCEEESVMQSEDAAFDAWLMGVDSGVLQRVNAALDLDAGRAAIFATALSPETVPERGSDDEETVAFGRQLDTLLDGATARMEQLITLEAPNYLPYQLDHATNTARTMTVVGRALLSDSMQIPWALAADFLDAGLSSLLLLKTGLAERDLERKQALDLLEEVQADIGNFCGVLRQCTHTGHGPKAMLFTDRLVATAELVQVLLRWIEKSIEYLFDDCGLPTPRHLPVQ